MHTGVLDLNEYSGAVNLTRTLQSGQSFQWSCNTDELYEISISQISPWYHTVLPEGYAGISTNSVIRCKQDGNKMKWESTLENGDKLITRILRLDDNLENILDTFPDHDLSRKSKSHSTGLRLVRDPLIPSLFSFICSSQMNVKRIHSLVKTISQNLGTEVEMNGETYYSFPTTEQISNSSIERFKDMGAGYRARYIFESAKRLNSDSASEKRIREGDKQESRKELKQLLGVGDKVADCVLLYSCGYTDVVPIDTWVNQAIDEYFNDINAGNYKEKQNEIQEFFGPYAGYVQAYIFNYLRKTA